MDEKEMRDPKIPEFTTIEDGYAKSNDLAHKIKFEGALSTAFQKLRDKFGEQNDPKSLHLCQLELEVQLFVFVDGVAKPYWIKKDTSGNDIEFPDLSKYASTDLDYIKERLSNSTNPTLKARYSHLLWESEIKHINYAREAVDSYILSIDQIRKFEVEIPKKSRGHRIENSLNNAWVIARAISYKLAEVIDLTKDIFVNYDYGNPSSCSLRLFILNLALENWKILGVHLFNEVENVFSAQKAKTDVFGIMEWLNVLGRINNKSPLSKTQWKPELAQVYEDLADAFLAQNNAAGGDYLLKAIELRKNLKDSARVTVLEKKYDAAKKSVKLSGYEHSLDLTEQARHARQLADDLLSEHGTSILTYLRNTPTLIPKVSDIRLENETMLQELALQRSLPQTVLDHRGNIVEHFTTHDEIKRYWELQTYEFHLATDKILVLQAIFSAGIKSGVITKKLFSSHLSKETWLSTKRKALPPIEIEETFVDLVLPSLAYFLEECQKAIADQQYSPNFVLCADSLTLKIEGLLRALCEQSGETTFFMKDDKSGRKIVNEQDINSLLFSAVIKRIFSEDEHIFLRFVLIEKAGINWRHKVAHSLSYSTEYSYKLMVMLVMCLLIVARQSIQDPS